jgi:hypothetical protein
MTARGSMAIMRNLSIKLTTALFIFVFVATQVIGTSMITKAYGTEISAQTIEKSDLVKLGAAITSNDTEDTSSSSSEQLTLKEIMESQQSSSSSPDTSDVSNNIVVTENNENLDRTNTDTNQYSKDNSPSDKTVVDNNQTTSKTTSKITPFVVILIFCIIMGSISICIIQLQKNKR